MKILKFTAFILSIIIYTGCTDPVTSEVSKVVSDHEQTMGNSKIDLNLKVQSVEFVKDYYAKDSLEIIEKYLKEKKEEKLISLNQQLDEGISDSADLVEKINSAKFESVKKIYKDGLEKRTEYLQLTRKAINSYNTNFEGTILESTYKNIQALKENPEEKLYTIYKVTYKINNPMLNNVEQEITKYYLIEGDPNNVETDPLKIIDKKEEL